MLSLLHLRNAMKYSQIVLMIQKEKELLNLYDRYYEDGTLKDIAMNLQSSIL